MSKLDTLLDELVTANRILAREEVVDSFGHISVRHPDRPDRFFLSRARAPDCIEREDIMEFGLDGEPVDAAGRKPYLERFIHGAVYEAKPDVNSVVHNHSPSVIPFGVTGTTIRPLLHTCACMGHELPIWDSGDKFGDTNMLVSNIAMGRDLARRLGANRAALLRGHGSVVSAKAIREVVYISVYLEVNARLQIQAMGMGKIKFLTSGEVDQILSTTGAVAFDRAWENWCRRAGRPAGAMTGV
ncbi:MAG TPA: class II aldolase/adducin family protein [Xanthobacteraceae bacterium]